MTKLPCQLCPPPRLRRGALVCLTALSSLGALAACGSKPPPKEPIVELSTSARGNPRFEVGCNQESGCLTRAREACPHGYEVVARTAHDGTAAHRQNFEAPPAGNAPPEANYDRTGSAWQNEMPEMSWTVECHPQPSAGQPLD